MKSLNLLAVVIALIGLALFVRPAFGAETRDPAPVVSDEPTADGRELIGVFDFVRAPRTVCENGTCRVVGGATVAPVANAAGCPCGDSCPCGVASASVAANTARLPVLKKVLTWYPGKRIRAIRGCN